MTNPQPHLEHHPELVVDYNRSISSATDTYDASAHSSWAEQAKALGYSEHMQKIGGKARQLSVQEANAMAVQVLKSLTEASGRVAEQQQIAEHQKVT